LIGFCRLRLDTNSGGDIFEELKQCALIREVHVYGYSLGVGNVEQTLKSSQHRGYGKLLVETAETIASQEGYTKIAVIAGVGTREYYKNKCGYELEKTYMVKYLATKHYDIETMPIMFIIYDICLVLHFIKLLMNYFEGV